MEKYLNMGFGEMWKQLDMTYTPEAAELLGCCAMYKVVDIYSIIIAGACVWMVSIKD